MPSMHVGIPLLLVCYAFECRKLKILCVVFYLVEIFSTIYLNQHHIIDLIIGSLYALIIYYSLRSSCGQAGLATGRAEVRERTYHRMLD